MRSLSLTFAAIVLFGCTSSLHASLLLSENFNELTPTLGVTSAGAFSTINGTNVDIVGAANGWGALCAAPASGNCIDLDGSGGNPIGQLQSNQLFSAGTYLLSFDLVGNQRGASSSSTTVSFGDFNQTFTLGSSNDIAGIISGQQVTLTAAGYLLFTSNDAAGDQQGNVLDDVAVSTAATPEPAGLLLLGTGLCAGMVVMMFRHRSHRKQLKDLF
jgi:hypothetical protein